MFGFEHVDLHSESMWMSSDITSFGSQNEDRVHKKRPSMTQVASSCLLCGFENTSSYQHCPKCAVPLILLAGKYQLEQLISKGGMGQLYLARHLHLAERPERVIKVIHPKFFGNKRAVLRFQREVQVTALLSYDNEHIVRVYDDFGEEESLGHYYIMEYLQGQPLSQFMSNSYGMPLDLALHLFFQMTKALQHAHQNGIIHRDLKPDNIFLIERHGDPHFVKIVDFGIARQQTTHPSESITQDIIGTPAYMSPEQCTNQPVDGRSDIYSLALIMYEMLTGRSPYTFRVSGQQSISAMQLIHAHLQQEPEPLHHKNPELSSYTAPIAKALSKEPNDRYPTMEQFATVLREASQAKPLSTGSSGKFNKPSSVKQIAHFSPNLREVAPDRPISDETLAPITQNKHTRMWLLALTVLLSAMGIGMFSPLFITTNQPTQPKKEQPQHKRTHPGSAAPQRRSQRVAPPNKQPTDKLKRRKPSRPIVPSPSRKPRVKRRTQPSFRRKQQRRSSKRKRRVSLSTGQQRKKPTKQKRQPVPQARLQKQTPTHPICGPFPKNQRWLYASLREPKKGSIRISFLSCRTCKLFRKKDGYCLQLPDRIATKVEISAAGYQSCIHQLPLKRLSLAWHLKLESAMDLADPSYTCFR